MITVGRLLFPDYPSENSSDPNYVLLYMAKAFDIELFLFEPKDVNYENKTINGLFCEHGTVFRKVTPIPPLVDNHYTGIDEELEKHTTLARIYPGDTKFTTYTDLKNDGKYKDILIPTFLIEGYGDIKARLDEFNEVVIKPVLGAQGVGVIKLAKDGERYQLVMGRESTYLSEQELSGYCNKNLSKDYILQQYIDCRTRAGEPFDVRVSVVDMGWNQWTVTLYPRIGAAEGILSNNSTGGYCIPIDYFLKKEFGDEWIKIRDDLLQFGREFPAHYRNLIQREIFDLGIDIGITQSDKGYKFWLFEANSMPPLDNHFAGGNIGINMLVAYFKYYHYLYSQMSEGRLRACP